MLDREPASISAYARLLDRLLREEADISLQLALVCGGVIFTLCISDRASALRTTITGDTLTIEVEPTWCRACTMDPIEERELLEPVDRYHPGYKKRGECRRDQQIRELFFNIQSGINLILIQT